MKTYPSIEKLNHESIVMYTFDKADGSNLRFEWTKKTGWCKFGTRTRLFDKNDPDFASAIPLFFATWAEPLTKIATDNRWEKITAFAEFYGEHSFAGKHFDEPKKLTLFDVDIYKKGILGPKEFLKQFDHLPIATYLGTFNWTNGFIDRVRKGEIEGITFEGVVGKAGEGHKLVMRKAKTQAWIDKIHAQYSEEEARRLIES